MLERINYINIIINHILRRMQYIFGNSGVVSKRQYVQVEFLTYLCI